MTTDAELAEKLYRMNTEDWTVYREQIIAALRREPAVALILRCRKCGSTNVEDVEREPATP